jgi:uncharacterized protein
VKRTFFLLVISMALGSAITGARAQENTKTAQIRELLKLTNAEAVPQQIISQMRAMTAKQLESMNGSPEAKAAAAQTVDKIMAQLQERMSWARMEPEYARLYGEVYNEEEISGILAFYKSAAGQAFVKKMPLLMSKSIDMAQRQMADLMPEIQRIAEEAARNRKSEEKK